MKTPYMKFAQTTTAKKAQLMKNRFAGNSLKIDLKNVNIDLSNISDDEGAEKYDKLMNANDENTTLRKICSYRYLDNKSLKQII